MELDGIVVKESPGLCRCCLSEGCYKDLATEYPWMNETEVYADMLLECFDISITQNSDGPNGPNRLICEVCITRLRDACNFKKQVLQSEKKFVDMVARKHFQPKAVLVYEVNEPMKSEADLEPIAGTSGPVEEIEYLEDVDFVEDYQEETVEDIQEEDITVSELNVKPKKSKKRKSEGKVAKHKSQSNSISKYKGRLASVDSSTSSLSPTKQNRLRKGNALLLLQSSNAFPFKWQRQNYLCFFCHRHFKNSKALKEHTGNEHKNSSLKEAVQYLRRDEKVKIDITSLACRLCCTDVDNLDQLIDHLKSAHSVTFFNTDYGVIPYRLDTEKFQCAICNDHFDYFIKLNQHMNTHYGSYVCESCGKSFLSQDRLRCHALSHGSKYKCDNCPQTFNSLTQKVNHNSVVHNEKISLKCSHCEATFTTYLQRKLHHKSEHNVSIPEFICPVCNKVFHIMSKMNGHIKEVHAKERNFECLICNQKFYSKSHVHKHMIRHYGEKTHECNICKKLYARKQTLRDHVIRSHSDLKYICTICSKEFNVKNTFKMHMKTHHPNSVT